MTTIAYKDGIIAWDGLITSGNRKIGDDHRKVYSVNKQVLGYDVIYIGLSGCSSAKHFLIGEELSYKTKVPDNLYFNAIAVTYNGGVIYLDSEEGEDILHINFIDSDFASVGSGSEFAMGAMKFGASASEAVLIASELDISTGGTISSLKLFKE